MGEWAKGRTGERAKRRTGEWAISSRRGPRLETQPSVLGVLADGSHGFIRQSPDLFKSPLRG